MILAHFPILYPDEDLRSVVYRFHVVSGNRDLSITNDELFGRKSEKITVLPRNLKYLMDRLPPGSDVEKILHDHTSFYWLYPFVPTGRVDSLVDEVMENRGESNIAVLLGKGKRRLLTEEFRYCPACITRDEETFGEVYLHRKHQLSFLTCCPEHGYELITKCPGCRAEFGDNFITTPKCSCGFDFSETEGIKQNEACLKPERDVLRSLEHLTKLPRGSHLEDLLVKMRNILGAKGYIMYTGRIHRKRMIEDFTNYLATNNYNQFLDIDVNSQMKTDAFILSGNQVKSILFYILFMMFLSGSVEGFVIDVSAFTIPVPFGYGPWICKNPVCPEFEQPSIRKCIRVDHQGKYISGLFGCPECGFSFAKRWKLTDQGKEKPYAVLTMGPLWDSILLDLQASGLSNTAISKKLKTSPGRIQQALARLKKPRSDRRIEQSLNRLWSSLKNEEVASTSEADLLNINRARIVKLLRENLGLSRSDLAKKHSHLYNKMFREDREWMEGILPSCRKNRMRVDWEQLDKQYCDDVRKAAAKLYKLNPPEQLKKYTILAHAPKNIREHMENSPEKIPKSIELINSLVETDEKYLVRHLPVIISQMRKYNKKITSLDNIKTFSPMYRKSTEELDEQLTEHLNGLLYTKDEHSEI